MGRGGSKKGEHRGNAKPRDGIATPNDIMKTAVKMVRKAKTPGQGKRPPDSTPRASFERDIQIAQVVHGRTSAFDLTPKEVILENMHTFQQAAYTSKAMAQWLMQSTPQSDERSRAIAQLQLDEERLRRVASDEAHKVMPFVHPRLAAIAISSAEVSGDILATLLEDIDRKNREHTKVIEHVPQKRTA